MLDGHWEERRGVSRGGDPADQGAVKQSVMFGKLGKFTGKFTVLQAAPSVLARWSLSEEEGKGLPLPSLKSGGWAACDKPGGPQERSELSSVSPQSFWLPPELGLLPAPTFHLLVLSHSCWDSGLPHLLRNIGTSRKKAGVLIPNAKDPPIM